MFTKNEKELVMMMGSSSFKMPYQTQLANPAKKYTTLNKKYHRLFSLMILMSCSSKDTPVQMPAIILISCV